MPKNKYGRFIYIFLHFLESNTLPYFFYNSSIPQNHPPCQDNCICISKACELPIPILKMSLEFSEEQSESMFMRVCNLLDHRGGVSITTNLQ